MKTASKISFPFDFFWSRSLLSIGRRKENGLHSTLLGYLGLLMHWEVFVIFFLSQVFGSNGKELLRSSSVSTRVLHSFFILHKILSNKQANKILRVKQKGIEFIYCMQMRINWSKSKKEKNDAKYTIKWQENRELCKAYLFSDIAEYLNLFSQNGSHFRCCFVCCCSYINTI